MQHSRRDVLAALTGLGAGALAPSRAAWARSLAVGDPAPAAQLTALDGRHWSTSALRGQVVILTFWATWCSPCRDELPLLSTYAERHAADGLQVLGFSLDGSDQMSTVRQVAATLRFPNGLLAEDSAPGYGRIWRLPVNFTIDRQGRLADNGWRDKSPAWTADRLEQVVTPLLRSGA